MKKYLILLFTCLLLAGCGAGNSSPAEQELNLALSDYPVTMDAQLLLDIVTAQYLNPMCGMLFRLDNEKGYVPELADDGSDFADDSDRYSENCGYDPERAKEYWDEGLEELGTTSLELEILAESKYQGSIEILKDQWEKTLPGFTLNARFVSDSQCMEDLYRGDFELYLGGWVADYPDPNAFLSLFDSRSPLNYSSYANPEYDRLLRQASLETAPEERFELLHKAEDEIMEDLGVIPLISSGGAYLISDRVKGVEIVFNGMQLDFKFAEKEMNP